MSDLTILADSESYILTHECEYAMLLHKQSKEKINVGDHYGDPSCGLIAPDEAWCVTGGEGLILRFRQGDIWAGFRSRETGAQTNQLQFRNSEDKRWLNSLTEDACYFVHDMRLLNPNSVGVFLDPRSDYASSWILDIKTKSLAKVADDSKLQAQPRTDDKMDF